MRKPLIIGHRGASAVAPENTIAAFKAAIQAGADGIEFDVQLSKDHIPVIIHDYDLRRTASVDKRVCDLTGSELAATDVGSWFKHDARATSRNRDEERVPLLQDLLQLYQSKSGILCLEMKCLPDLSKPLATVCFEMIASSPVKDRIIVESFDLSGIAEMKRLDASIQTAALFEPKFTSPHSLLGVGLIEKTLEVGADAIALHRSLANPRIVEKAKVADLYVVVWTVDDPRWLDHARSMGIDALITNNPSLMLV